MKEKIKRILDLIRGGKLTLNDAAPLLAALNTRLALQTTDRELLDSLLKRDDLDTAQVAEHLMLLRGLKDTPPAPTAPPPAQKGSTPGAAPAGLKAWWNASPTPWNAPWKPRWKEWNAP